MAPLEIPASHGHLEGLLWTAEAPRAAVLVCHPHPLHGGTMNNNVVYRTADAFRALGCAVLRFNFRGVGRSTGQHDEGRGELDDAQEALDFLGEQVLGVPLWVAGFSFGSRVALRLALREQRIERALAVGMATNMYDFEFVQELKKPKAFIHSEHDEHGDLNKVRALVGVCPEPKKLFVVPDANHLCVDRLDEFAAVAQEAVAWLASVQAPANGA